MFGFATYGPERHAHVFRPKISTEKKIIAYLSMDIYIIYYNKTLE